MRALRVVCATALLCALAMAVPATASAFMLLDTSTGAQANAYGLWYAGQAKCASPECHQTVANVSTAHGDMVADVKTDSDKLVPGLGSGLWPVPSPFGGVSLNPGDMFLQVGDPHGLLEYAGSSGAYATTPASDLPLWSPVGFEQGAAEWEQPASEVKASAYFQSCGQCHNLGVTRPSDKTYTLPNGAEQTTQTPTSAAGLSIQCEVCHGTGDDPTTNAHQTGVPQVVGGYEILKAQVCGQCHVTGTTVQKNAAGKAFGNPNGYTTDETLTAYLTPSGAADVPTEAQFEAYVSSAAVDPATPKPKFLPNGDNFSLRHSYYNEWLLNKAENGYGHTAPTNTHVTDKKCLGCHSGLGFLSRIGATNATGAKIVTDTPEVADSANNAVGISCQVCHNGHVSYNEYGGYDLMRTWGPSTSRAGDTVGCPDCHNWQFETLGQALQSETIGEVTYDRPAVNARVSHPQREMLRGGYGGDSGNAGLWGVEAMGPEMGSTSCEDCHMPRTSKEGVPANDDGSPTATRMSHRFHVVLPGDAKKWNLRKNGDSCLADCHQDEASSWTRDDFQAWIDGVQTKVGTASDEATGALGAEATELGLSAWSKFIAVQPTSPSPAAGLTAAEWTMLQRAAQNAQFVTGDSSKGVHNAAYAVAGIEKANYWAASFDPASFTISVADGYRDGGAGVEVAGSLRGHDGSIIEGARVTLEASTDGGATWETRGSVDASATSFSAPSGQIVGDTVLRFAFAPAEGVTYYTENATVSVPKTTLTVDPVSACMGWLDAPTVGATLEVAPAGSITFYALSGAQVSAPSIYSGPFAVTAEGATTITYWSVNADGAEAIGTAVVKLDCSAPTVASNAKALYADSASVVVTGSDVVSPIMAVQYSLDGGSWVEVVGGTATVTTSVLGNHTLKVRAVDSASHTSAERTYAFAVRNTPKLAKSPNVSSITKRLKQTQTFAVTVRRGTSALAGKYMYLERSTNGRTWTRIATLKTGGTGVASKAVKFTARGTTYWRWTCPNDAHYNLVRTTNTKVTVR